jgi:hypothetical protein
MASCSKRNIKTSSTDKLNLSFSLIKHHNIKKKQELEVQIHRFIRRWVNCLAPREPSDSALDGPKKQYGPCGKESNLLTLTGIE